METIVMGKKIEETYKVDCKKDDDGKFLCKPTIVLDYTDTQWEEILSYKGEAQCQTLTAFRCGFRSLYISEDEEVSITKEIFRADLECWIQYTNKVLEKKDNIKKCEKELKPLLEEYNIQKITDDPKAKAYCDLHKLNYAETDYEELMEIIEPVSISENLRRLAAFKPLVLSKDDNFFH